LAGCVDAWKAADVSGAKLNDAATIKPKMN
jgi:hypothetical protein